MPIESIVYPFTGILREAMPLTAGKAVIPAAPCGRESNVRPVSQLLSISYPEDRCAQNVSVFRTPHGLIAGQILWPSVGPISKIFLHCRWARFECGFARLAAPATAASAPDRTGQHHTRLEISWQILHVLLTRTFPPSSYICSSLAVSKIVLLCVDF